MPFCSPDARSGLYDSTPIENLFLTEYLPNTPDSYLRVYLYLRMLCLHPEMGSSPEEICRALHIDAQTLDNAMTYWERQGLITRMTDNPPTYAMLPVIGSAPSPMESDYYRYRDFNGNLQAIFGDNLMHPKQYEQANDWLNVFHVSQEAVLLLARDRLAKSRSKKPNLTRLFDRMDETIREWADKGIVTAEDAERALATDGAIDHAAAAVMRRLSMRRAATADELKMVSRWLNEWGYTEEEILSACAETTKAYTPTMAYLNTVLEKRRMQPGNEAQFAALRDALRELGERVGPTPDQLERYARLRAQGFEEETIRFAAVQCARKNKRHFTDLEWMLDKWGRDGVHTYQEAVRYVETRNRSLEAARRLLERAGSERSPQLADIMLYESWEGKYADALIDYAAECARGTQMPMRYMDKLLAEWQKAGVDSVDAARAQRESRAVSGGANAKAANAALNYAQHSYTDSDFDDIYLDLNKGVDEK